MLKLLALLPCLLLVAVSAEDECADLLNCEEQITEENLFDEGASLMTYSNSQILDHVCGELSGFVSCIHQYNSSCSDVTIQDSVATDKALVEYMCSPTGRNLILSLAESDCADNPLLELQVENMMQGCLESFTFYVQLEAFSAVINGQELQLSALCPYVDELKNCLVQGGKDLCGDDLGTFFGDIWDIASEGEFEELNCAAHAERKRRYVKRALPILMKRAKMLKKLRK